MISDERTVQEINTTSSVSDEDAAQKLPDKSRSLRARSIQKRLETERNKICSKVDTMAAQEKYGTPEIETTTKTRPKRSKCKSRGGGRFASGSTTMSKYRRKTANAKERDRMKTVNEAFEKLKSVVPVDALLQQQQNTSPLLTKGTDNDVASPSSDTGEGDENLGAGSLLLGLINPLKSTKVSTLRCAIAYINSLQKLIEDSEKGILDPSFYENDEKEKEDKNSSIEKLLGKRTCFNGDNNNNRDKKKKRTQSKKRNEKRDLKGNNSLNEKKISMIAASLGRNLPLRKIGIKKKNNDFLGSKGQNMDILDFEKVMKNGSRSRGSNSTRGMSSILSASIPEIMDIIRSATGLESGYSRMKRKRSTNVNKTNKTRHDRNTKRRKSNILHLQKSVNPIPQSYSNGAEAPSNKNIFQFNPLNQPLTHPAMSTAQQRPSTSMNNLIHYIQPIVKENRMESYVTKPTLVNVALPLSPHNHQPMKPQITKNKFLDGFALNNLAQPDCNGGRENNTLVYSNISCDTGSRMTFSKANKLTPPQVKRLLSSLTPLMNPTPVTSSAIQVKTSISSISPISVPVNSTLLLSPPPSNSSCSNYSCDDTSTTSSLDDVNMSNPNIDCIAMDTNSCLISPSSNNMLSSSSLHTSNTSMGSTFPSKMRKYNQNTTQDHTSSTLSPNSIGVNSSTLNSPGTNTSMDILDDIQQVLKDAENFDMLFS